jgi:hypothetical protein
LLGIDVQFEHMVASGHCQIVIISPKTEPPIVRLKSNIAGGGVKAIL